MSELFVLDTEMSDTKFVTTRARRRRLTGAGIEKRHSNKTQQISEGSTILTPVSALHSRKKED